MNVRTRIGLTGYFFQFSKQQDFVRVELLRYIHFNGGKQVSSCQSQALQSVDSSPLGQGLDLHDYFSGRGGDVYFST